MGFENEEFLDFLGNPHKPDYEDDDEIYSDQDDEVWNPHFAASPPVVMEYEDPDDPDWNLDDNLDDVPSTDDGDMYLFDEDDYETTSNVSEDSLPIEPPPPNHFANGSSIDDKLEDFTESLDPIPNSFPES